MASATGDSRLMARAIQSNLTILDDLKARGATLTPDMLELDAVLDSVRRPDGAAAAERHGQSRPKQKGVKIDQDFLFSPGESAMTTEAAEALTAFVTNNRDGADQFTVFSRGAPDTSLTHARVTSVIDFLVGQGLERGNLVMPSDEQPFPSPGADPTQPSPPVIIILVTPREGV